MNIDWKRKLTSRKLWAAAAGFVSMMIVALGKDAETAQIVTGLIMAGGSLMAYIIGEGRADSGAGTIVPPITFASLTDAEGKDDGVSEP